MGRSARLEVRQVQQRLPQIQCETRSANQLALVALRGFAVVPLALLLLLLAVRGRVHESTERVSLRQPVAPYVDKLPPEHRIIDSIPESIHRTVLKS
jgi:hypothetical protein